MSVEAEPPDGVPQAEPGNEKCRFGGAMRHPTDI